MRPPRHLADRRVDDGEPEQIQWSAGARAHRREMNLAAAQAIRRVMDEQTGRPAVELIDGGMGPPSAVIEPSVFDANIEPGVAKWDRQSRDSTGKYVRSRRK
jgi:hypothetical protein